MTSIDQDYFMARAAEHRRLAEQASAPNVAGLHRQLAKNYEDLAMMSRTSRDHSYLRSVAPVTDRPHTA